MQWAAFGDEQFQVEEVGELCDFSTMGITE